MDISMDIHEKSVDMDMDMDMDVIFHIHGNPENIVLGISYDCRVQSFRVPVDKGFCYNDHKKCLL